MDIKFYSVLSLFILHVLNPWMSILECAHEQPGQKRSLSFRMPNFMAPAGGTRQWFATNANKKSEFPGFSFFRPNGLGWPSASNNLFQSNQIPVNTGIWSSSPSTSNENLPFRPVFLRQEANDNSSSDGTDIVSFLSSASLSSDNNDVAISSTEVLPLYKNKTTNIDTTVNFLPTAMSDLRSNKNATFSDQKNKLSLFQGPPIRDKSKNNRKTLPTSWSSGQPITSILNNASALSPTIKSMNAKNNVVSNTAFQPWSLTNHSSNTRTIDKSMYTDFKSKTNAFDENKNLNRPWLTDNKDNDKGIRIFRKLHYKGNTDKGGKSNDTRVNRFHTMFEDLMSPSSVPKSSEHFVNLPDSIRERIEAMNTEPLIDTPIKSRVFPSVPLTEHFTYTNATTNVMNRTTEMRSSDAIFPSTEKGVQHSGEIRKQTNEAAAPDRSKRLNQQMFKTASLLENDRQSGEVITPLSLNLNNNTKRINVMLPSLSDNFEISKEVFNGARYSFKKAEDGGSSILSDFKGGNHNDTELLEKRKANELKSISIQPGVTMNTADIHIIHPANYALGKITSKSQTRKTNEKKVINEQMENKKKNVLISILSPLLEPNVEIDTAIAPHLGKSRPTSNDNVSQQVLPPDFNDIKFKNSIVTNEHPSELTNLQEWNGRRENSGIRTKDITYKERTIIPTMQNDRNNWRTFESSSNDHLSNRYFSTTETSTSAKSNDSQEKSEIKYTGIFPLKSWDNAEITKEIHQEMIKHNLEGNQNHNQTTENSKPGITSVIERQRIQYNNKPNLESKSSVMKELSKLTLPLEHSLADIDNSSEKINIGRITPSINSKVKPVLDTVLDLPSFSIIDSKTTGNRNAVLQNRSSRFYYNTQGAVVLVDSKNNFNTISIPTMKAMHNETADRTLRYTAKSILPQPRINLSNNEGYMITSISPLSESMLDKEDLVKGKNMLFTLSKPIQYNRKATEHRKRDDFMNSNTSPLYAIETNGELWKRNLHRENKKIRRKQRRNNIFWNNLKINELQDPVKSKPEERKHRDQSNMRQRDPSKIKSSELLEKLLAGVSGHNVQLFNSQYNHEQKANIKRETLPKITEQSTNGKSNFKYNVKLNPKILTDGRESRSLPISILEMFYYGLPGDKAQNKIKPRQQNLGASNVQKKLFVPIHPHVKTASSFKKAKIHDLFNVKRTGEVKAHSFPQKAYSDMKPKATILKQTIEKVPHTDYVSFPDSSSGKTKLTKMSKNEWLFSKKVIKDETRIGINILNYFLAT